MFACMDGKLKELTRAEQEVMHHLWELERAFVKEILAQMPEPKPAYNTVSTIVRILEEKGFVGHEAFGRTHRYYPLISKEAYSAFTTSNIVSNYFNGSFKELVSFFVKKKDLDLDDLDDILKSMNQKNEPS
jgi:predicted transcriptional regulator